MTPESWASLVLVASFLLLAVHGVPIAFCIGLSALLASIILYGSFELAVYQVAKDMWHGMESWALLAIPFFVFAGLLMGQGGIARRLIDFANVLVGRLAGGLGYANVLSCMLFGAVSGSAVAATSSIGSFMVPEMEKEGYPREFSAALTTAASTLGLIIPPSNIMIVYAVAWGKLDVAAMFMGGFLPGVIVGLLLMIVAGFQAVRGGYGLASPISLSEAGRRTLRALLSLAMLIIVMGGILAGYFTATEAGAVAAAYAFLLAVVVYRQAPIRDLPRILVATSVTTGFIFLLVGSSLAMGKVMTRLEIPQAISGFLLALTENPILLLLLINLLLLCVGAFMDMTPAVLIFTPILQPLVVGTLGMHPIHFGLIMITNLCIGLCTPPVGTVLFVGCGIGRTTITRLIRPLLPFYAAMIVALLIITYLPEDVILWLPRRVSPNL